MSEFSTYECEHCGEQFRALDGANAAENGYCSPRCESEGKGLN
jgi:hypothetical protein